MEIHKILIAFEMCSFTALPRIRSSSRRVGPGWDHPSIRGGIWSGDPVMKTLDNASNRVERKDIHLLSLSSKKSSDQRVTCTMAKEKHSV